MPFGFGLLTTVFVMLQFQGTEMAKYFESLVRNDPFFEIPAKRHLGLVVFRLKVMCSRMAP